ncbi:MAG: DNA internalization-related competence protein ComEC/Rec2 [Cellvibrionaceae bacterium]
MLFRCLTVAVFAVVSFLPSLPSLLQLQSAIAALGLLCVFMGAGITARYRPLVLKIFLLMACASWAMYWGASQLQQRLPRAAELVDIQITGVVVAAQSRHAGAQTLEVVVIAASDRLGESLPQLPRRLRLTKKFVDDQFVKEASVDAVDGAQTAEWSQGEGWQFWVRLKRPKGFANPGGFDYERWLLARGIDATGYVKTGKVFEPQRRAELDDPFHLWIGGVKRRLMEKFGGGPASATLSALAFGDRSGLNLEQNQLLQRSGLSHLLAISGLHVGLAAVFGAFLGRYLGFGLVCWRPLVFHGPIIGLWVGVGFAVAYAAVAGFSLATQRALVMLVVAALWLSLYRRYSPWLAWWWSMLAVLILQPLSLLEPGFWFSFVAVAVLMLLSGGRMTSWRQRCVFVIKAQCLLFLCLLCLQWYLGSSVSVLSPVANLLAIPFVSVLVVPQILLALIASAFSWEYSQVLWSGAHLTLSIFWAVIQQLEPWVKASVLPLPATLQAGQVGVSAVLAPVVLLFIILPFPLAFRGLAMLVLISVLTVTRPEKQSTDFFVLDVGQGLSVVATSHGHSLLYDTGPQYSPTFSAGDAVVIPFLELRQPQSLDLAVISHWDSDHYGGHDLVADAFEVKRWLASDSRSPQALELGGTVDDCAFDSNRALGAWRIRVLGYGGARLGSIYRKRNDRSCVLLLESNGFRVLLPGDIERLREMQLLSHPQLQQPVDVMIAPHHGSGTSSSQAWVSQLRPSWVVFSSGYRNRYRHPQAKVQQRYERIGSVSLSTSQNGGLHFQLDEDGQWGVEGYRQSHRRYWR